MAKRILFSLLILFSFTYNVKSAEAFYSASLFFAQNDDNYFFHTIERGETVYSIAKMYHVSEADIYRLNPGSEAVIKAGDRLMIPQESASYIYHTIQPKETLYSLSKQYFMKGDDIIEANPGLSVETFTIGRIIRIPTNIVTEPIQGGNESLNQQVTNSLLYKIEPAENKPSLTVGLLLPFGLKEGTTPANAAHSQIVEYYEGFLLALKEMVQKGVSIRLKVYDVGDDTKELLTLIQKNVLQEANLLIGGISDAQVNILSRYSKDHAIPYVIPVAPNNEAVLDNSRIFQINPSRPYLYSNASMAFINRYKADHIILIKDAQASNKTDFTGQLEADLSRNDISYSVLNYTDTFASDLSSILDMNRNNVVIPSDDTGETLSKLINQLKMLVDTNPDFRISLFGYPTWQTYAADFSDDFFRLNTVFYSFFYANPVSLELKTFYNTFYNEYSRDLMNRFPKFGILGYDTGKYFIELLNRYGMNYDPYVNDMNFRGIQTDFHFERINNWSGFMNTNLYLIEYAPNQMILKTTIR